MKLFDYHLRNLHSYPIQSIRDWQPECISSFLKTKRTGDTKLRSSVIDREICKGEYC